MSVYHPDENVTPKNPPSSDSAICAWPSCGHTAKGQCRGAARRIQLFTDDQLAAAVADAVARAERAEAALNGLLDDVDAAILAEISRLINTSDNRKNGWQRRKGHKIAATAMKNARSKIFALTKIAALKGGAA